MKIFLSFILADMKPQLLNNNISKDILVQEFMNLESKKLVKFKEFITICNEIKSPSFNEVLLNFFEGQCQTYFLEILNKYKNNYSEKCCEELLFNLSLSYLKKAIQYLDYNNNNNILKLDAIAYIKTYFHFYVEINYNHFDKCNFDKINEVLNR